MNRARRSIFVFSVMITLLLQAPLSFACGPFSMDAVFVFTVHPEYPLEQFARGEIGVVQPSYARSYLYVAYRYLKGNGFDPVAQQALVDLWRDRLDRRWDSGEEQAVKSWLDARQKVPGLVGPAPKIDVNRSREKPNDYESYLNCQNDAFETAAITLGNRLQRWGADSSALKIWVEAQDQVFANCSEGQHIPSELPVDADALLRADRQYQIAAATFYSGNFGAAKTLFESIAGDAKSPWRAAAPYLVARTLIRRASLGPDTTKQEALTGAEQQLNKILANHDLQASHVAAKRLLSIVRLRLHPEERLHELALALASKTDPASLKQELWDYTILLDQFAGDSEAHHQKTPPAVLHDDDMTDWIVTLQSDDAAALNHSLAKWETTSSIPWLIAALSKIDPQHPKATVIQQAAAKIPAASAAFPSALFHSVRLDIGAGRTAEARTKLNLVLGAQRSAFTTSALNLLQQERMLVSTNLDDFILYAQRQPAGFTWNEDGRQIPADASEVSEEKALQGRVLFDSDAGEIMNHRMPLALLSSLAGNNRLPNHLRRDVTQAAWLRALLLGDHATATTLAPALKTLAPELAASLDDYVRVSEPGAKKFSALYAWLHFPALEPVIKTGAVRRTPLDEQDSYRDNWWCSAAILPAAETGEAEEKKPGMPSEMKSPPFITAAQRTSAEKEWATLAALGATPNYLCQQVIDWATKHPADPRVPEALHLAVKTTRYGCTDKQTGKWSKAAHDLLHRRYPGNEWTKQTPYWFKD